MKRLALLMIVFLMLGSTTQAGLFSRCKARRAERRQSCGASYAPAAPAYGYAAPTTNCAGGVCRQAVAVTTLPIPVMQPVAAPVISMPPPPK